MTKLLTIEEVADRTRLPVATLRFYRTRGDKGPKSARIGARVMYREADVEAWIEQQFTQAN